MDVFETMLTRRSIRAYVETPVEGAKLDMLLRAAMSAPTAGNQRSWRFVVLRDDEVKTAVASASPYAGMLPSAPLAIVVCADTADLRHPGFWPQDCAAATQNILLAAHALGLGAVWLGYYPDESRVAGAQAALGIESDAIVPFSVVPIGYPAERKERADRFDESRVHYDRW